jgi:hypothetical protein
MESCSFIDFLEVMKPWLDSDYIRKGFLASNGNFTLFFSDGGEKSYRIDDCSEDRIKAVFDMLVKKGIPVEKEI